MNTVRMFDEAKRMTLPRHKLIANIIWAVVSQSGRGYLTVGEIAKMVNLTSGCKPSTYQVKEAMRELLDMNCIEIEAGPTRGKGLERVYAATHQALAALACYSYALDNKQVHAAAMELTHDIWSITFHKFNELKKYNKQLEAQNE